MRSLTLSLLALIPFAQAKKPSCLSHHEVTSILSRWSAIFENRDPSALSSLVNATMAPDVVATDNGINFLFGTPGGGPTGPYATNRDEFYESVAPQDPLAYNKTFTGTSVEYNCRSITYRWEAFALTRGPSKEVPNIRAKPNVPFSFRGTDLLHVHPGSCLIHRVDSSGDYLNYLYAAGLPVGFALGTAPGKGRVEVDYPAEGY